MYLALRIRLQVVSPRVCPKGIEKNFYCRAISHHVVPGRTQPPLSYTTEVPRVACESGVCENVLQRLDLGSHCARQPGDKNQNFVRASSQLLLHWLLCSMSSWRDTYEGPRFIAHIECKCHSATFRQWLLFCQS